MAAHRKRNVTTPIWNGAMKFGVIALNLMLAVAAIGFALLAIGPHFGHYRTLTMLSGSMAPKMPTGSVVLEVPKKAAELAVGDVITISAPTEDKPIVTHRVIEVTTLHGAVTVRTKGDNNPTADAWESTIVGDEVWVAKAAIPYVGTLTTKLRSSGAHLITALLLPLLLVLFALRSIWAPSGPRRTRPSHRTQTA